MQRHRDHGRRLSAAERVALLARVAAGDTHAMAAAPLDARRNPFSASSSTLGGLRRVAAGARRSASRSANAKKSLAASRPGLEPCHRAAPGPGAPDHHARRGHQWRPHGVSGVAGGAPEAHAHRPKLAKLARCARLRTAVERGLAARWSPEQIAQRLRLDHPTDPEMRVSHETIYRSLFVQTRGALRRELAACLRTGRTQRKPRGRLTRMGRLLDTVPIADRPPAAADRAVPGHWEGDLLFGRAGHSAIGTLVERRSRYVLLFRLPHGRTAAHVRRALARLMQTLPTQLRRTLTWDQGKEMAEHVRFRVESGIPVYFCDPRSPWQRPSSENTNGLLRQYFPRSTVLTATQAELDAVARELNGRPRQTLGWRKPCEVFARDVAVTG